MDIGSMMGGMGGGGMGGGGGGYGPSYGDYIQMAGDAMQGFGSMLDQMDMNRVYANQLDLQQRYRNQAMNKWYNSLPALSSNEASKEIATGAANRMNTYGGLGGSPLFQGSNFSAADKGRFGLDSQARANLGGYSDWQLQQQINRIKLGEDLNKISNFAQGSLGLFPLQMQKAQHDWDLLNIWGQFLTETGGQLGGGQQSNTDITKTLGQGGNVDYGSLMGGQGNIGDTNLNENLQWVA